MFLLMNTMEERRYMIDLHLLHGIVMFFNTLSLCHLLGMLEARMVRNKYEIEVYIIKRKLLF